MLTFVVRCCCLLFKRVERRFFPDSGALVDEELLPAIEERRLRKEGMIVERNIVLLRREVG